VPSSHRGLLARLDALVALVTERHGLALLPDGRLAAAEARVAVRATGLTRRPRPRPPSGGSPPGRPGGRGLAGVVRDAVELLRAVAEGVGLLRVRGDRLEATSLRNAWAQIDEGLRAGLVYAAWCQQVTFYSLPLRSSKAAASPIERPRLRLIHLASSDPGQAFILRELADTAKACRRSCGSVIPSGQASCSMSQPACRAPAW
jgi:hypothetical protein